MNKHLILAGFCDSCMVMSGGKVVATGVEYHTAVRIAQDAEQPTRILQEFMDADGYPGYVERPYNMA